MGWLRQGRRETSLPIAVVTPLGRRRKGASARIYIHLYVDNMIQTPEYLDERYAHINSRPSHMRVRHDGSEVLTTYEQSRPRLFYILSRRQGLWGTGLYFVRFCN